MVFCNCVYRIFEGLISGESFICFLVCIRVESLLVCINLVVLVVYIVEV